jgi:hypothetical protein
MHCSKMPKSMSHLHPDGVLFIPIERLALSAEICLAYRRSAAVRNFVTVVSAGADRDPCSGTERQL